MKWWDWMPCSWVFRMLSFKTAFPLSFHLHQEAKGLEGFNLHIWGCWYFSWQSWFQLMIHPAQHDTTLMAESEKEMATHSSVLAWRIPGTGKPRGLPSLGLHRVGYDWSDLAAAAAAKHIMQNAELDEAQAEIKIARRNIDNLRYADDTTLMAESE